MNSLEVVKVACSLASQPSPVSVQGQLMEVSVIVLWCWGEHGDHSQATHNPLLKK